MLENDTPDVSVPAQDAPPATGGEGSLPSQSAEQISSVNDTTVPSDQVAQEPTDPLKDVPTAEQVAQMQTVSKEAFLSLRNEYDKVKPQLGELTTKYSVFEPVADRFQTAEEVQSLVTLNESLNKYSPDPETGALRPDTAGFVEEISTKDAERADDLTSRFAWGMTKNPANGQPIPRMSLLLQAVRYGDDQELRSSMIRQLGGVEESAVQAPTWAPAQDELDRLVNDPTRVTPEERALQETFKKLSYEDRMELSDRSPEFVKNTLRTIQQNQMLQANEERRVANEERAEVEAAQKAETEANDAGDQYVEQGFKGTFTNFANQIYETWKPTDNPEVNKREGALVALAVAALSTPDTRFAAEQAFKEMGIDQKTLDEFNAAREAYAQSGREFGYLSHKKQRTNGDPARSQQKLLAKAKDLGTLIIAGRNEYFKTRATAHNDKLDQTERARIPVGAGGVVAGANGQPARHRWANLD